MNRTAILLSAVIDILAVLIFVIIGRASHDDGLSIPGILTTFWPFAAGAVVGWTLYYGYSIVRSTESYRYPFRPASVIPAGVAIWFCTLAFGMALRVVSHQGIVVSFVIVAGIFLALFLIGGRWLLSAVIRQVNVRQAIRHSNGE